MRRVTVPGGQPEYDRSTHTITIPDVVGVVYTIGNVPQEPGPVVINQDTIVEAVPADGFVFRGPYETDWFFAY